MQTVLVACTSAAVVGMLLLGGPSPEALALEIGPEEDLCAAIHGLAPGDEVVLRPGDYQGPCTIRQGGSAGAPLVIRAADLSRRPRLVYTGTQSNVLSIRADHVTVRGLRFGPAQVDAIRIYSRQDITIEECEFSGVAGIAVVANNSSLRGLTVRRNIILDSHATAMYFGCHDGFTCELSDLLVEGNYIHRAGLRDPEGVGYGLQVKLNSVGIIRDNVIVDTKGPPIMVYGSRSTDKVTVVERNFVAASRQSSGIVVGGGPAVIRNNVAMSNAEAGIGLEDYGRRGLLRGIAVAHNSVYGNESGGILVPTTVRDVIITNNAVHSRVAALPSPRPGLSLSGNVDCFLWTLCFTNPDGRNFSPGALLTGLGVPRPDTWFPLDDFFGGRRGIPPTIGAIEQPRGSIKMGRKPD